jgi:hypothetical protein
VSYQFSALPLGVALPTLGDVLRWAAAALDAHFVTLAGQPKEALVALLDLQVCMAVTVALKEDYIKVKIGS